MRHNHIQTHFRHQHSIEISINETQSKLCECCLFRIHMSFIYDCLTIFPFFRAWQCQQRCKNVFNRNRCADITLEFALDVNEWHALHYAFCICICGIISAWESLNDI